MKKSMLILLLLVIFISCKEDELTNDAFNLNQGSDIINIQPRTEASTNSTSALYKNFQYYFHRGNNNPNIYYGGSEYVTPPLGWNTAGASGQSGYSPYPVFFDNKIWVFHIGNTNSYMWHSNSSDGVNWAASTTIGNTMITTGYLSPIDFQGQLNLFYAYNSNIYVTKRGPTLNNWTSPINLNISNDINFSPVKGLSTTKLADGRLVLAVSTVNNVYLFQKTSTSNYVLTHTFPGYTGASITNWGNGVFLSAISTSNGNVVFASHPDIRFTPSILTFQTNLAGVKTFLTNGQTSIVRYNGINGSSSVGIFVRGSNNNNLYQVRGDPEAVSIPNIPDASSIPNSWVVFQISGQSKWGVNAIVCPW